MRGALLMLAVLAAVPAAAQHDITQVEPAAPDAAISTPLPDNQQRRMKKYDIPDLAGATQALGSLLLDGQLRRPLIDLIDVEGAIEQRISVFEGGLAVVRMTGAGSIRKKVLIPPDALDSYLKAVNAAALEAIPASSLPAPEARRSGHLRVYAADGSHVDRLFHPGRVLPKQLADQITPLQDLMRAIVEDREVTSSVAGYDPKPGDELVADDQKVYRVIRVIEGAGVVELQCLGAPTTIFVTRKDLHLYFIGKKASE